MTGKTKTPVFVPVVTNTGDGFTVKPGKPLLRLTPRQFASCFGVTADAVYLWIADGTIAEEFIEKAGKRKFLIAAAAVAHCQKKFKALRSE